MKFPITGFMLIIHFAGALAQDRSTCTVSGMVRDHAGKPLPFCHILIDSLSKGTTSNTDGYYELRNIPRGTHKIIARSLGFETQSKIISVHGEKIITLNFSLKKNAEILDEVIFSIESQKQRLERSAQAVDVIETRELKLQTIDLGEIMAHTQGVNVRRNGGLGSDTRFSLNGLTDDQIRFFLDGMPLDFSPYAFGIANVPVNLVDHIEIYKGVVPIRFGSDALGGAVNIVSPDVYEGVSGSASYQVGSFGTHRMTLNTTYLDDSTGLFVSVGGFYDYAENNYEVDVEVPDERGRLSEITVPRFHDTYSALGLNFTTGLKDKSWAEELSIGGYYADYDKEIQHNNFMSGNPFGDVMNYQVSAGANLTYRKEVGAKTSVSLVAGYNYTERIFEDTAHCVYNWFGECINVNLRPGEAGEGPDLQYTWDDNYYSRLGIGYYLNKHHKIRFSSAPTLSLRTGDELFAGRYDPHAADGRLFSWVNGVEYQLNALEGKLENIFFVKNYHQFTDITTQLAGFGPVTTKKTLNYHGLGNGLRYRVSKRLIAKLSYEWTTRQPRPDEIFGDGLMVIRNPELEAERSHNLNLELDLKSSEKAKTHWQLQNTFFFRQIDDLIIPLSTGDEEVFYLIHLNVFESVSLGLETATNVKLPGERVAINVNTTYQNFYNSSRDGQFSNFYGDRIPNRPYLFVNGGLNYNFKNTLLLPNDRLNLFWNMRYVHEYFLSWESAGIRDFKALIPSQFLQNVGITYQLPLHKLKWALTVEMQNLTDARVFDFFGVQRPGRAFFVKLSTQF